MTAVARASRSRSGTVRAGMRVVDAAGDGVGTVVGVGVMDVNDARDAATSLMQVLADGLTGSPTRDAEAAARPPLLTIAGHDGGHRPASGVQVGAVTGDVVHLVVRWDELTRQRG